MSDDDIPLRYRIITAIIISILIFLYPLQANEAFGLPSEIGKMGWDYGSLKAVTSPETIITPKEQELQPVHYYGNGSCVPYARIRTGIVVYGWAKYALENAVTAGYATGTEPVKGAMLVTNESDGHVAAVEEVREETILISEQNYKGLYIVSYREIKKDESIIKGYIYKEG